MSIYTRAGDNGTTGLLGQPKRIRKNDPLFNVLGDLDETSAIIGIAGAGLTSRRFLPVKKTLEKIQRQLFEIGSLLVASDPRKLPFTLTGQDIEDLEHKIDSLDKSLTPLKNFILPGGHPTAATLHHARTVCRQTERNLVSLMQKNQSLRKAFPALLPFINRLSDYLFTLARYINRQTKSPEIIWIGRQKPARP